MNTNKHKLKIKKLTTNPQSTRREKSTICNIQSTTRALGIHNRCDNCIFSTWTISPARPALICMQKASKVGKWHIVPLDQSCSNFYPSTNIKLGLDLPRPIPLTRGMFAIVDAEDYYQLSQYNWHASGPISNNFYASGHRKGKIIKMHRLIMNAPDHLVVDHIDHNGLNNCKANLRLCTQAQNACNSPSVANSSSKYKGVSWNKEVKKWRAMTQYDKKKYVLGYFKNEIDAARAYDEKAKELHGEFAYLNFSVFAKATTRQAAGQGG